MFRKIGQFIRTHKKTSILVALVIIVGGYFGYKSLTSTAGDPTYMLGTVQTGTIVSSITGTGQVSTNRSLDLKPQASANVTYVGVTAGQYVNQGDLVVELDTTDAQKSVRDAQASLESAQLSLQKLQEPADPLSILQDQDAVTQANSDLTAQYASGANAVSSTFLDLPGTMTSLDNVLHGTDASPTGGTQNNESFYEDIAGQFEITANSGKAEQYATDAEQEFQAAQAAYNKNFADYKNITSTSSTTDVSNIIQETYATAQLVDSAVKSATDLIQYYQNTLTAGGRTPVAKSTTDLTTLSGLTTKMDADVSSLLSIENGITSDTTTIPEKTAALSELQNGADPIDVQSSQLDVTKAQNALQDAKDTLQNYYVYAPFSGTISAVDVHVGDPASSGTAVATLIADNDDVVIPLNEVDVAKVKMGDKATLTFDAIDGLTLTGKITEIDTVGTVSQGVVNYNVTISLDTVDPRVKPGMSTTASIITQVDSDVLTVPSSAVKTSAAGSYVQAFTTNTPATDDTGAATSTTGSVTVVSATPPEQIPVTTGISDGTNTEIDSGLTAGEQIVTRTVAATAAKPAAAAAPSLLGGATAGRAGGAGAAAFRGGGGAAAAR